MGNAVPTSESERRPDDQSHNARLPILIFPGFMSSALEVLQSNVVHPPVPSTELALPGGSTATTTRWKGKRVWLDIKSAGFESLYLGSAMRANEILKENGETYNEHLHLQFQIESESKRRWIDHIRLASDLRSEMPGIQVRHVEGLKGVDYLVPGKLGEHVAWVFLPVIRALCKAGYTEGLDLDAVPYDWRLPPMILEERDGYFTKTILRVERMYEENGQKPIVLLCHSMGSKTCHYFLNFCLREKSRKWLDTHIHTYMPVGAPHLGASKSFLGVMVGDKMGLDSFLSDEEALILGRSWGSVPWLYPGKLPPNAPHNAFLKREGKLQVKIQPFDISKAMQKRRYPPKLRLKVKFGNQVLYSKFRTAEDGLYGMKYEQTFLFAAPPDLNGIRKRDAKKLQVFLEEPLFWRVRKDRGLVRLRQKGDAHMDANPCCGYTLCSTMRETAVEVTDLTTAAADTFSAMAVATRNLAATAEQDILEILNNCNPTHVDFPLWHGRKRKKVGNLSIFLNWQPPAQDTDTLKLTNIAVAIPNANAPRIELTNTRDDTGVVYDPVDGVQLIRSEFLPAQRSVLKECYETDPLGPRTVSAEDAPPVKRVKAIYGINLPTHVSAVFRRRDIIEGDGKVQNFHELDSSARLTGKMARNFVIDKGVICETRDTPQSVAGSPDKREVRCSGDGTVPYWSLQHCRTWSDRCQVTVDELEGAEHRNILSDVRFHRVLLDYVLIKQKLVGIR